MNVFYYPSEVFYPLIDFWCGRSSSRHQSDPTDLITKQNVALWCSRDYYSAVNYAILNSVWDRQVSVVLLHDMELVKYLCEQCRRIFLPCHQIIVIYLGDTEGVSSVRDSFKCTANQQGLVFQLYDATSFEFRRCDNKTNVSCFVLEGLTSKNHAESFFVGLEDWHHHLSARIDSQDNSFGRHSDDFYSLVAPKVFDDQIKSDDFSGTLAMYPLNPITLYRALIHCRKVTHYKRPLLLAEGLFAHYCKMMQSSSKQAMDIKIVSSEFVLPSAIIMAVQRWFESEPSVVVVGDGASLRALHHIEFIMRYQLNVKWIVIRDDGAGRVNINQPEPQFFANPCFVSLAISFGLPAQRVVDSGLMIDQIIELFQSKEAGLLEIPMHYLQLKMDNGLMDN